MKPLRKARPAVLCGILACGSGGCGEPPAQQPPAGRPGTRDLEPSAPEAASAFELRESDPELAERVDLLRQRIDAAPADADPWRELAYVLEANGQRAAAGTAYERWSALAPDDPCGWYHLARLRSEQGELESALAAFDTSLALEDAHPPTHWRRGLCLLALDRLDEAAVAFRHAVELAPEQLSGWVGLARVALESERPEEARELLLPQLATHGEDGYLHHLLGRALLEGGDEERALAHLEHDPSRTKAWKDDTWMRDVRRATLGLKSKLRSAREALGAGEAGRAVELLEPFGSEQPDHPSVQGTLVQAYVLLERFDDALDLLERARAMGGENYRTKLNRAVVAVSREEIAEAIRHLQEAVALNREYAPAHLFLGQLLLEQGELEAAYASLARAVGLGEVGFDALMMLAMAEQGTGRLDGARDTFERAGRSLPQAVEPWLGLANVALDRGDPEAARLALGQARSRDAEHPGLVEIARRLDVVTRR